VVARPLTWLDSAACRLAQPRGPAGPGQSPARAAGGQRSAQPGQPGQARAKPGPPGPRTPRGCPRGRPGNAHRGL